MSDGILKGNGNCRNCGIRTCGNEAKAGLCGHCKPLDRGPALPEGSDAPLPWNQNAREPWVVEGGACMLAAQCELEEDAAAIVHRVNGWDALCDRVEAAEAEAERLRASTVELHRDLRAEVERLRATLARADAALTKRLACGRYQGLPSGAQAVEWSEEAFARHRGREQIGNTAPDTQEKT